MSARRAEALTKRGVNGTVGLSGLRPSANWTVFCLALAFLAVAPQRLHACAACFGQSDSPLAQGMNMGILSLLVVVVSVLGGIAAFFIYLVKRSSAAAAAAASKPVPQASK